MCECNPMNTTWEKILEYASSPVHGTMSRKLRKGVSLKVNGEEMFTDAQIFISDQFVRFTTVGAAGEAINSYYDVKRIMSIQTVSTIT
jgi:hypothetical protein